MKKSSKMRKKKKITVAVSGGFDPIHAGHIRHFKEAKALGKKLVVILNNDNWLLKKKGYVFMNQEERKEIIEAIGCVDEVIFTSHSENPIDMSVCEELKKIKPSIFANGGDRKLGNIPVPEVSLCEKMGCQLVYNVGRGGKIQSSSWLVKKVVEKHIKEQK